MSDNFWVSLLKVIAVVTSIPLLTWYVVVMTKSILRELYEQLMPEERYAKWRRR